MKISKYSPKINTPLLHKPVAPCAPEEVAKAQNSEMAAHGAIAAAIDFLYNVEEDALRKQTKHLLESHS